MREVKFRFGICVTKQQVLPRVVCLCGAVGVCGECHRVSHVVINSSFSMKEKLEICCFTLISKPLSPFYTTTSWKKWNPDARNAGKEGVENSGAQGWPGRLRNNLTKGRRRVVNKVQQQKWKTYGSRVVHRRAPSRRNLQRFHRRAQKFWDQVDEHDSQKEKATFLSPTDEWFLPAASTTKPEEREFVVDSWASMHMVSMKDFNTAELETVRISKNPTMVMAANGEVRKRWQTK